LETSEASLTLADEALVSDGLPRHGSGGSADESPKLLRVEVDSLKANPRNFKIYRESLQDAALEPLAQDIANSGQHEPIIVNPEYMILDGHRRRRALQLAGARYALVIVDYTPRSVEEELDYILDSYTHKRQASLAERVNIFDELVESYARRFGRGRGRPKKVDRNLSDIWDANRIRDEAARGAGFGSRETARRASTVMRSSDDALKQSLDTQGVSIDAAYHQLMSKESPPLISSGADSGSNEQGEPPEGVEKPQPPEAAVPRKSGRAGRTSKGRRRPRGETTPVLCSSDIQSEKPLPSPPAESHGLQDEALTADDSQAEGRADSVQAGRPQEPSASANAPDIEAILAAADLDELLFAICRRLRAADDNKSPDFRRCVDRVLNMIRDAAGTTGDLKPVAKATRRAHKVA
jgi:hypothetical protein